ncbi:MAG: hypothetical protein R6U95_03190 [Bacteroidales bacterium]
MPADTELWFYLLCFVLGICFWLWFSKKKARHLQQKKIKRGLKLEEQAAKILTKNGYNILSNHEKFHYSLYDNTKKITIHLESDYVVSKRNKTFLVEVKSGEHTAHITYAATRRQLLEYYCASNFDGYILINMHTKTLHTITFPFTKKKHRTHIFFILLGISIGAALWIPSPYNYYTIYCICLILVFGSKHIAKFIAN